MHLFLSCVVKDIQDLVGYSYVFLYSCFVCLQDSSYGFSVFKLSDLPGGLTKFLNKIGEFVLERFEVFLMLLCSVVHIL